MNHEMNYKAIRALSKRLSVEVQDLTYGNDESASCGQVNELWGEPQWQLWMPAPPDYPDFLLKDCKGAYHQGNMFHLISIIRQNTI